MKRLALLIPVVLTALFVHSQNLNAAEALKLQLRWHHGFQFAGYYMAKEKGFFQDHGLDVTFLEGGVGINQFDGVLQGKAHFGVAGSEIAIEYLKGSPFKTIATIFQHSPYALMVRKSSGYITPQQLSGKRVYMALIPRTAEIQAMFINEGVPLDRLVVINPLQTPKNVTDPGVDAFSVYSTNGPFLASQSGIETELIRPITYGIDFYGDCLFTTEDFIKQHKHIAATFKEAALRGWAYAFEHPEESIDVVFNSYNTDNRSREHLAFEYTKMKALIQPDLVPFGQQNPYRWAKIAETYTNLGMAPQGRNAEALMYDPERAQLEHIQKRQMLIIRAVVVALTAAVVLFLWTFLLKRQVRLRTRSLEKEINAHTHTQEKLHIALDKYQTLFTLFPYGISVSDGDGNVIETNAAAEKLLGISKDDHEQRTIDGGEWRIIRADGTEMPSDEWASVRALKENRLIPYCTMGICRAADDIIWLNVSAAPLPIEGLGVVVTYHDITENRASQELLRKQKEMLSRTEAIAHIGSWQWEIASDRVIWSDELFQIFKRDPGLGAPSYEEHPHLYLAEDIECLRTMVERAVTLAEPYELELRAIRSDGEIRHCHAQGFPEKDASGKVVRLYGFLQDNTERYSAQKDFERLAHDQSMILDNVPAYIYFKDTENNIIRISESVAQITGLPKHEIEGRHSSEIYPEMADQYWEDDLEVIRSGTAKTGIVEPLPIAEGERRWLHTDKIPVFDGRGNVSGVIVMASDITEMVEAQNRQLESESRFRALFEYAADGLYLVSEEGEILDVNRAAQRQTGYQREELLQMGIGDLDPRSVEQNDRGTVWSMLQPGETFVLNTTHVRKDGSTFPAEIHISIIEYTGRRLILGFVRDITERREIERRLHQAQKIESIGTLAGGIAHDFNNILSSIIGFTELALEDVDRDSLIEDNLQEVYTAGKRAKELVNQILAFARQSGEEMKPIQIDTIVTEVLQFIRSSTPTNIEFTKNIDSDSLIMGNQTQVHQILMNLCANAAHAMEDDGGILNVTVGDIVIDKNVGTNLDLTPGNYIRLSVSDTGTGISPEIIDLIFDPYFTTKASGEGTGMGLAMVQGIVESHGGKIAVSSIIGEGTTFIIYIPVTRKREMQREYEPDDVPSGTERILFVDDEASIAKMGSQMLEKLGYQVTTRTSSVEALELIRSKPDGFDLVITDMTMPNMTGDKLALEVMKIEPNLPVVLCTGYSKKISEEAASEIGIKAFAYKPVVKAELARTIRKVLDGAKS